MIFDDFSQFFDLTWRMRLLPQHNPAQQQQSNKPVQRSRPSPKKVVSEDESDDDNYDDGA